MELKKTKPDHEIMKLFSAIDEQEDKLDPPPDYYDVLPYTNEEYNQALPKIKITITPHINDNFSIKNYFKENFLKQEGK